MPGPFPGMDPYLEIPFIWSGIHQRLITGLSDTLNEVLPPGFISDIGERTLLMKPERGIYPDVVTFTQTPPAPILPELGRFAAGSRGGAAVAERETVTVADAPLTVDIDLIEVREPFVEVRPVGGESEVIAVIEVLSPVNKTPGHTTRKLYRYKQRDLLNSTVHLIEIDLLRTGAYTVGVPEYALNTKLPRHDYLVCLHRGGQGDERERFEVWAPTVRDRLPRITVPLTEGTPDITLDLQQVFDRNYDGGAYQRRIDYRQDATVPLQGDDAAWADALLRERGLRP